MSLKKTALFELHKKLGAKFVQFAGYEMPIQYNDGIIKEHNATRDESGIFDVSHMGQLFIEGNEDLTKNLQKIFPIDLKKLQVNQSKYSFLMKDNGGIYDDLIITKLKNGYMIILNAACKESDLSIIKSKLDKEFKVELKHDFALILGSCCATLCSRYVSYPSSLLSWLEHCNSRLISQIITKVLRFC